MIGADEAGRGPVLGPLVVAAIRVADEEELMELGVKDSKKLTPRRRERLYQSIKTCCELSVERIGASMIDELRTSMTLNQIEKDLFVKAVDRLPYNMDRILVDCCDTNQERFSQELRELLGNTNVTARHRADEDYPCVAAASIVAKVNRDTMISHIDAMAQERWGVSIGSGYPSDPNTCRFLEFIDESGEEMPFFVRRSWKTVGRFRQLTLDI